MFLAVGVSVWNAAVGQDHPGALGPSPDGEVDDGNVGRHGLPWLIWGGGDLLIFITDYQGGKCTDPSPCPVDWVGNVQNVPSHHITHYSPLLRLDFFTNIWVRKRAQETIDYFKINFWYKRTLSINLNIFMKIICFTFYYQTTQINDDQCQCMWKQQGFLTDGDGEEDKEVASEHHPDPACCS